MSLKMHLMTETIRNQKIYCKWKHGRNNAISYILDLLIILNSIVIIIKFSGSYLKSKSDDREVKKKVREYECWKKIIDKNVLLSE